MGTFFPGMRTVLKELLSHRLMRRWRCICNAIRWEWNVIRDLQSWEWRFLLVYAAPFVKDFEMVLDIRKLETFLASETQKPTMGETFTEQPEHPILKLLVEVDKYVTTQDKMHLTEYTVNCQIMVGKGDNLPQ